MRGSFLPLYCRGRDVFLLADERLTRNICPCSATFLLIFHESSNPLVQQAVSAPKTAKPERFPAPVEKFL